MGHKSTKHGKRSKRDKHSKDSKYAINNKTVKLVTLTYDSNHKVFVGDIVIYEQRLYIVRNIGDDDMVGISMYTLPTIKDADSYNEDLDKLDYYTPKELILFQRSNR